MGEAEPLFTEEPEEAESKQEEEDERRPVSSSMVSEVGYEDEELQVVFANGSEHSYPISREQWQELLSAPSVGRWLWENVDLSKGT